MPFLARPCHASPYRAASHRARPGRAGPCQGQPCRSLNKFVSATRSRTIGVLRVQGVNEFADLLVLGMQHRKSGIDVFVAALAY